MEALKLTSLNSKYRLIPAVQTAFELHPMALHPRRAFVALATANFEQTVAFYQTLLEQSPKPFMAERYAEFQLGESLGLAIFPPKPDQQEEFTLTSAGPLSLCLEVADLEGAIAHLDAQTCPHSEVFTASHGREVYAYDPQGNRLIIYQPNAK